MREQSEAGKVKRDLLRKIRRLSIKAGTHPPDGYKFDNTGNFRAFEAHRFRIAYWIKKDRVIVMNVQHGSFWASRALREWSESKGKGLDCQVIVHLRHHADRIAGRRYKSWPGHTSWLRAPSFRLFDHRQSIPIIIRYIASFLKRNHLWDKNFLW